MKILTDFLVYLLCSAFVTLVVLAFCIILPQNKKVVVVREWIDENLESKTYGLLVLAALVAPVVLAFALLIWAFGDDSGSGNARNPQRENAVMLFVWNAMYLVMDEQPAGVFPIIKPKGLMSMPIQPVIYKRTNAYQLCVSRPNDSITPNDAAIFKLHLNVEIARHLAEGSFPAPQDPSLSGADPAFKVIDVLPRNGYWDIFIGPANFVDAPQPIPPEADTNDDEF